MYRCSGKSLWWKSFRCHIFSASIMSSHYRVVSMKKLDTVAALPKGELTALQRLFERHFNGPFNYRKLWIFEYWTLIFETLKPWKIRKIKNWKIDTVAVLPKGELTAIRMLDFLLWYIDARNSHLSTESSWWKSLILLWHCQMAN